MAAGGRWTTGLCGCFEDSSSCCCALWCPCVLVGRTTNVVNEGAISAFNGGAVFCLLQALAGFGCFYSYLNKSKIRNKYGIPGGSTKDLCAEWLCNCCSVAQAYRELKNRNIDPSLGYEAVKSVYDAPNVQQMHNM